MDVWGHRALVCVVVVIGCLLAVGTGAPVTIGAGTAQSGDAGPVIGQDEGAIGQDGAASFAATQDGETDREQAAANLSEADEIHVTIDIHENRSATVTVDYRYQLEGDNESALDWDGLRTDIESNSGAYTAVENESWQNTLERGMNRTDREMELSAFAVTTDKSDNPVEIGHVRFRFEWSSFATGEPNYLEAGDALVGFTLVDHTRLTIGWPDSYNATTIRPEPTMRDETSAHWDGSEIEFDEDQPRVALVEGGAENRSDGDRELGWGLTWQTGLAIGLLAIVLVVTVGLTGWLLRRDYDGESIETDRKRPTPDGAADSAVETPPTELLSNEEQVLRLLEQRGGRVKQQQVVSELDWTEAKTSQVVTGLRESGEIEVFRIGRENVLVLADEDE